MGMWYFFSVRYFYVPVSTGIFFLTGLAVKEKVYSRETKTSPNALENFIQLRIHTFPLFAVEKPARFIIVSPKYPIQVNP